MKSVIVIKHPSINEIQRATTSAKKAFNFISENIGQLIIRPFPPKNRPLTYENFYRQLSADFPREFYVQPLEGVKENIIVVQRIPSIEEGWIF